MKKAIIFFLIILSCTQSTLPPTTQIDLCGDYTSSGGSRRESISILFADRQPTSAVLWYDGQTNSGINTSYTLTYENGQWLKEERTPFNSPQPSRILSGLQMTTPNWQTFEQLIQNGTLATCQERPCAPYQPPCYTLSQIHNN